MEEGGGGSGDTTGGGSDGDGSGGDGGVNDRQPRITISAPFLTLCSTSQLDVSAHLVGAGESQRKREKRWGSGEVGQRRWRLLVRICMTLPATLPGGEEATQWCRRAEATAAFFTARDEACGQSPTAAVLMGRLGLHGTVANLGGGRRWWQRGSRPVEALLTPCTDSEAAFPWGLPCCTPSSAKRRGK